MIQTELKLSEKEKELIDELRDKDFEKVKFGQIVVFISDYEITQIDKKETFKVK